MPLTICTSGHGELEAMPCHSPINATDCPTGCTSGRCELEASVMCGAGRRCGAAALLTHVRNPVLLARQVMDASPHILLTGEQGGVPCRPCV